MESAFRRSQTSGTVHRLYQVKGKRNIRAKEVELSWSSFNRGDCFILDLGEVRTHTTNTQKEACSLSSPRRALLPQTIVSWSGSKANIFEKQKVREIASLIRDTERHGKARIIDTSEGEEPEEMLKVVTNTSEHQL